MGEGTTTPRGAVNVVAVAVAGRGLVEPGTPVFAADDESLLRGRAVFETTRTYDGRPFRLDAHIHRFARSADSVGIEAPDAAGCTELAQLVIDAAGKGDLALRLYWTGRTLVATAAVLDPGLEAQREHGIRLAVVRWSTGTLAGAKSMSYAENMAAQDEAVARGADDALLVAHDDTILEAPTANVWLRQGSTLLTPALELPILAGVTRATIAELAPGAGFTIEEGRFPLDRIHGAEEVFITSSIREVMPVAAVDGTSFRLGPASRELQRLLRERATA